MRRVREMKTVFFAVITIALLLMCLLAIDTLQEKHPLLGDANYYEYSVDSLNAEYRKLQEDQRLQRHVEEKEGFGGGVDQPSEVTAEEEGDTVPPMEVAVIGSELQQERAAPQSVAVEEKVETRESEMAETPTVETMPPVTTPTTVHATLLTTSTTPRPTTTRRTTTSTTTTTTTTTTRTTTRTTTAKATTKKPATTAVTTTTTPRATQTLPYAQRSYELLNLTHFRFIIPARSGCDAEEGGERVLIIVHSTPDRALIRQCIRDTFGGVRHYRGWSFYIYFMLAEPAGNRSMQARIQHEAREHGDIVQGNFVDAYHNMTYKHMMGLLWSAESCPSALYIIKVDDDVYMDLFEVLDYLVTHTANTTDPGHAEIMCNLFTKAAIQHSPSSKWYLPPEQFPGPYYPPYCWGAIIIYTRDAARKLSANSKHFPYIFIDDAALTGFYAEQVGIRRRQLFPKLYHMNQSTPKLLAAKDRKAREYYRKKGRANFGALLPDHHNVTESRQCEYLTRLWQLLLEDKELVAGRDFVQRS